MANLIFPKYEPKAGDVITIPATQTHKDAYIRCAVLPFSRWAELELFSNEGP